MSSKEQLFVLRPSRTADRFFASTDDNAMHWQTLLCSQNGSLRVRRTTPLIITRRPNTSDKVIWTWYHDLIAVSDVKEIVRDTGLTGCCFDHVYVSNPHRDPGKEPDLWELRVSGFAGFVRPAGMRLREACPEHEAYSFGFEAPFHSLFDRSKWDGSDLFTIWPFPLIRICTVRFAEVIRSHNISGLSLMPIEEFELVGGTAAPGIPMASLCDAALKRLESDPDYIRCVVNA